MIKNLIFDFGKVLVNHDLQPLLERHFGDDEVSLIGFHKILSDPKFINMCDRGIIPFDKMIDGAIKRSALPASILCSRLCGVSERSNL